MTESLQQVASLNEIFGDGGPATCSLERDYEELEIRLARATALLRAKDYLGALEEYDIVVPMVQALIATCSTAQHRLQSRDSKFMTIAVKGIPVELQVALMSSLCDRSLANFKIGQHRKVVNDLNYSRSLWLRANDGKNAPSCLLRSAMAYNELGEYEIAFDNLDYVRENFPDAIDACVIREGLFATQHFFSSETICRWLDACATANKSIAPFCNFNRAAFSSISISAVFSVVRFLFGRALHGSRRYVVASISMRIGLTRIAQYLFRSVSRSPSVNPRCKEQAIVRLLIFRGQQSGDWTWLEDEVDSLGSSSAFDIPDSLRTARQYLRLKSEGICSNGANWCEDMVDVKHAGEVLERLRDGGEELSDESMTLLAVSAYVGGDPEYAREIVDSIRNQEKVRGLKDVLEGACILV